MGQLVDGVWQDIWYDTKSTGGRFKRSTAQFRNWVTADGQPGEHGVGGFRAEAGRYHLYVSLACPGAPHAADAQTERAGADHSGLGGAPADAGKRLDLRPDFPETTGDPLYHTDFLYQIYLQADPHYSGRVTVPVLWDKQRQTIVSNESADIIRMFNSAFDGVGARGRLLPGRAARQNR